MSRPAIYIRWSSEDQGQGTTLQVQRDACLSYCDRMGWHVPEDLIFVDDGYSGGNMYRPGLEKVRKAILEGLVDTVVVYRLDRLSRDLADSTFLVGREWRGKAVVRSATEDVKPEADEGWLNYSFRAAFADYERRVIRQRTLSGKVRRLKDGLKVHGALLYGYKRTSKAGVFDHEPDQAAVVQKMYEKCARENMGLPAIAKWLNEMGYPSPKGKKWAAPSVRNTLINPAYKGVIIFGRQKQMKHSSQEAGPWYRIQKPDIEVPADPDAFPAIVSEELWEAAQEALTRRRARMNETSGRGLGSDHLLTGLLHCRCGGKMRVKHSGPNRRQLFRCNRNEHIERCPHEPGYIPVAVLDEIVVRQLMDRISSPDFRARLGSAIEMQVQEDMTVLLEQRSSLEEEIRSLNSQLQFIDGEFLNRRLTIDEVRRFRGQLEQIKGGLEVRLGEVDTALADHHRAIREKRSAVSQADLAERWNELTNNQRREVIQHFIRRIEALRFRQTGFLSVHIHWAFQTSTEPQAIRISLPRQSRVDEKLERMQFRKGKG